MRYTYAYKTSDGTRHEAAMDAPSRDAVFAALRERGIRAIKVVAADGSKSNGEVRGIRKRIVAALLLLTAAVAGILSFSLGKVEHPESSVESALFTAQTRRQVIGDAAIIDKGIRTGWSNVFVSEGDRFLASFAIPGANAGVRTTNIEELNRVVNRPIEATSADGLESRQIKAMVEGMKQEARAYVAAGGTIVEYGNRLTERQDAEIAIYKRAEAEVLAAQKTMSESAFNTLLEQRNDELRNLGIRPITLSD